jgi:hypothetical protein
MGDLATLAKRMKQLKKDLPDRVSNLTVEAAERVVGNLVASPPEGTPVDTSQAMSNWLVGVGSPKVQFRRAYSEGVAGSTAAISRDNVIVFALSALQGRKKPGEPIYISNSAPYIRRLAYEGHSKQSPPGWVEGAVQEARRWIGQQRGRLLS